MYSNKAQRLISLLEEISPLAVALSGGLDSSVVARAAEIASERSIAVTVDDFTVPRRDIEDAKRVARISGIPHVVVRSKPPKEVLSNPADRCFYCKKHNYGIVFETAGKIGITNVVDGANADDTREYRPGMNAAKQMGVRSPLLELGFGKADTRGLAKEFGLPVWDKPSSACLSSRIPHGSLITERKLSRVEASEEAIRKLTGIQKVRVRSHEKLARIEVPREQMKRLLEVHLMESIARRLREEGFTHVTLDLEGYRPGGVEDSGNRKENRPDGKWGRHR